jgi:lysophospholipase L1-like esterase
MRFAALPALALPALALLAACATTPALPAGAHYAALGSSYAAGAGNPPLATDRPERCGASQLSYARLLAARLGLTLTDASCGGATTAHVLGAWNEQPPQIDAVRPDTRLVTITIGGNDLNYMGLMFAASCHAGYGDARLRDPATGACRPVPMPDAAAVQAVEDNLATLLSAIRARAPLARVVLVQYVALAGEVDCPAAPLDPEHAAMARLVAAALAQASSRAAGRAGAQVLAMDQLSQGHLPCDADPWARGLGAGSDPAEGAPWHPTAAGHAAIARELEAMLSR